MNLSRRRLLTYAPVVVVGLSGCTAAQINAAVQQAASDALTIANGLTGLLTQLGNYAPASVVALAGSIIAKIQAVATAMTAASQSGATSLVNELESLLNALVSALAGLPGLPSIVTDALNAASILLPIIEGALGMVISEVTALVSSTATPATAAAAPKTAAWARTTLLNLAK